LGVALTKSGEIQARIAGIRSVIDTTIKTEQNVYPTLVCLAKIPESLQLFLRHEPLF
jgi:hypothetical protein